MILTPLGLLVAVPDAGVLARLAPTRLSRGRKRLAVTSRQALC